MLEIIVKTPEAYLKLYKYLFIHFSKTIPISTLQKLVRTKRITVNNKPVAYNYNVTNGDIINILKSDIEDYSKTIFSPKRRENLESTYSKQIQKIKQSIIYEDNNLIIFNKASGLAVQGGSKVNFSLNDAFTFIEPNLQIVHRIDKETSGLLITAKNRTIAAYLHNLFRERRVKKTYLCLVTPYNSLKQGILHTFLQKGREEQKEIMIVNEKEGQEAISEFTTLEIANNVGLLKFCPITGRKHQIRAQATYLLKAPIVGDYKYGYQPNAITKKFPKRIYLHAYNISFPMPNEEVINISAPLDANFQTALSILNIDKEFLQQQVRNY